MAEGRAGMAGPLWAVEAGNGLPLVLLHGNGESHRVFDALVPLLAGRRRLVGLDSRGHGDSPRGDGSLRIGRMADDVDAALSALGLAGVDVLGFSDGGNIALELALRHPGRAGRLVLVGANLSPDGLRRATLARARAGHAFWRGAQRVVSTAAAQRVAAAGATQRVAGGDVAARVAARAERASLMADEPRIDPGDLARVDIPVLVVVGARDLIRPEHTRLIVDSLPDARLATVEGAGHMVPRTHAPVLAALVEDFLAGPRTAVD